jgi:hypothetical protein
MACEPLDANDPKVLNLLANTALDGITAAIAENNLPKIKRSYVGVGPIPAEDCCPDLVAWITNIRLWDQASPDTLIENRVLVHFGLAFNINIRIGDCFWELDPKTMNPYPPDEITKMSDRINQYGVTAYLAAITALHDLGACNLGVHPLSADPYQDGGCGGFTFAIGVSLI